jgi:hypothetical protein
MGHVKGTPEEHRDDPDRVIRERGEPCHQLPRHGQEVCKFHGGNNPDALRLAKKRETEKKAQLQIKKLGLPLHPEPISHTEALIWLVSSKYAEVCWLREKVAKIPDPELVWGVTSDKVGGHDGGTTSAATPNIWWEMLRKAEDQLVKFATAAHAAGVDDAMVDIAKARGMMMGAFLDALMDNLKTSLIKQGVTQGDFSAAWSASISSLFPAAFRALGSSKKGF